MLTIHGIPNCDSCRKARKWLDENGVEYDFHDLRTDGLERAMLERWAGHVDWQRLLNTRSTTWRGLPEAQRKDLGKERAIALMLEHPTLIKRPLAEKGEAVLVGFSSEAYERLKT